MYDGYDGEDSDSEMKVEEDYTRQSPFPDMPSQLFNTLAQSQFELLSNSLVHVTTKTTATNNDDVDADDIKAGTPKISSMVLYLPKENQNTGQLEFVPAVSFPTPQSERVFIAASSDSSNSGIHQPPLGLPGFFSAQSLIPTYPFVSSTDDNEEDESDEMFSTVSQDSPISVSVVEEIALPNANSAVVSTDSDPTSLSVTLFSGLGKSR